jgi:hypothetical protein
METYEDSVRFYADERGNLPDKIIWKLMRDHGLTMEQWRENCDSVSADNVLHYLGY